MLATVLGAKKEKTL